MEYTQQDLLKRIADGIEDARSSENFQVFLKTAAKFHNYSIGNTILIAFQRPEASQVAGFHTWLSLGRHVRKGEKAIRILAPMVSKRSDDDEEERTVVYYKSVCVFDIAQTDGDELPSPVQLLEGDDNGVFATLANVAAAENLTLDRDANHAYGDANGYYVKSEARVWVDPQLPARQAAKTLAHELAHHFADHPQGDCREDKELVAEAAAFMVMSHFSIDSGDYSFGYLASWSDAKTFKARATEIQKVANTIISQTS